MELPRFRSRQQQQQQEEEEEEQQQQEEEEEEAVRCCDALLLLTDLTEATRLLLDCEEGSHGFVRAWLRSPYCCCCCCCCFPLPLAPPPGVPPLQRPPAMPTAGGTAPRLGIPDDRP